MFEQVDDIWVFDPSQGIDFSINEICEASVLVENFYSKLVVKAVFSDLNFATSSYAKCFANPQVVKGAIA